MKDPRLKQVMKVATIAGASILVVGAVMSLTKVKSLREGLMPAVSILVGVAAFTYATKTGVTVEAPVRA